MEHPMRIYFDHAATTPLDPQVRKEMLPFFKELFGNPSSIHSEGRTARLAVEKAREQVGRLAGAKPSEVIFTASGTESDNMAITGITQACEGKAFHLITSAIEHPAVLEMCKFLQNQSVAVTYLPVNQEGIVEPDSLRKAIRPETGLISIMAANNVTGVIQPVEALAEIAHEHSIIFHTDAVQACGKMLFDIRKNCIDMLSISAHKLHGPKGIGALIVREGISLIPLIHGGGQELGRRSATENVAGIVGFGKAAELAIARLSEDQARLVQMRDKLIEGIQAHVAGAYIIGHRYRRLPGHICIGFSCLEGEAIKLLLALDEAGISVSTGSACSAHRAGEPSYVLMAMGFDPLRARGSLRITLGRFNTDVEIEYFLHHFPCIIATMKPISQYVSSKQIRV